MVCSLGSYYPKIINAIKGENIASITNAIAIPIPSSVSPKCLFIYLILVLLS